MNLTFITKEWLERHGDIPACSGCGVMAGPHFQTCPYREETFMHYRNGREAKNGDEIVQLNEKGQITHTGVLIRAVTGNDYCNGIIANDRTNSFSGACLIDCLHMEDVAAMPAEKAMDKRPTGK